MKAHARSVFLGDDRYYVFYSIDFCFFFYGLKKFAASSCPAKVTVEVDRKISRKSVGRALVVFIEICIAYGFSF